MHIRRLTITHTEEGYTSNIFLQERQRNEKEVSECNGLNKSIN